jgi:hypothetical protein
MKAYNQSKYPVFEADQVLSHKHLNAVVSHLEEQDRLTRKDLSGIGIVCGLELQFGPTSVTIKCGTAVTSLGYLIEWETQTFSLYKNIELSKNFLEPSYATNEGFLAPILSLTSGYLPIKNCIELLPAHSDEPLKVAIPNGFFDDRKVVLLLETSFIDEKNCVAGNCDDKGKRIEFNLRPLLINNGILESTYFRKYPSNKTFEKIVVPRYNVPASSLNTGRKIVDAFDKNQSTSFVQDMVQKISALYDNYDGVVNLKNEPKEFRDLVSSFNRFNTLIKKNKAGLNHQYIWDWIEDIAAAYNEIIDFILDKNVRCCVNEELFPFHVVLGTKNKVINYRTPFFETKNAKEKTKSIKNKITLLFERLTHVIFSWDENNGEIRITPSRYGNVLLSEKAIPFYYDSFNQLKQKWNPILTQKNRTDEIKAYHDNANNIQLHKDTEPYNFFRIEGHLRKNYVEALREIKSMIAEFRLPIDVIALNAANFENQIIDRTKVDFDLSEFETDFIIQRGKMRQAIAYFRSLKSKNIPQIDNLIDDKLVNQIDQFIAEDFELFIQNKDAFNTIVLKFTNDFTKIRNAIFYSNLNKPNNVRIEELIDQLDHLFHAVSDQSLIQLAELAAKKGENQFKQQFFTSFSKKHPGIEHKAGVTKGGTFILVYEDYSVFKRKRQILQEESDVLFVEELVQFIEKKNKNSYEQLLLRWSDAPEASKTTQEESKAKSTAENNTKTTEQSNAELKLLIESGKIDADQIEQIRSEYLESIKRDFRGLTKDQLDKLREKIFGPPKQGTTEPKLETVEQKVVIADFFLPYRCCSDGNSIQFNIGNEPTPPKVGDFLFPDFNENDFKTNK